MKAILIPIKKYNIPLQDLSNFCQDFNVDLEIKDLEHIYFKIGVQKEVSDGNMSSIP